MGILRDAWRSTLGFVGPVIPAAGRQCSRMMAQDLCASFKNSPNTDVDMFAGAVIVGLLKDAGDDVNADKTYIELLGFKGGKKEFDSKFPQP